VPYIDIGIQPFQPNDRVTGQPSGRNKPVAERMQSLHVVVMRPMPKAIRHAQLGQLHGHGFRIDVAGNLESALLDDATYPAHHQLDILLGVRSQTLLEGIEVPRERRAFLHGDTLILRVDQPTPAKQRFILQLGSQLLRERFVGEALPGPPNALMVRVRHVPECSTLAIVPSTLEYGCH